MLARLLEPIEIGEADRALAARLLAERSPEDIAAALVHAHRAALPEPEDLLAADTPPPPRAPREGFEGSAWFRLNVGRRQNADPRWILPLLCRRGHLGRGEIGAIRIAANETLFEVPQAIAGRFLAAVQRTAAEAEDEVEIVAVEGAPPEAQRHVRRDHPPRRSGPNKPRSGDARPGSKSGAKPTGKKGNWHNRPNRKP